MTTPHRWTGQNFVVTVVSGGAAGDITVSGITTADDIIAVIHIKGDGTQLTGGSDLTTEFSIASADTINNAAGTASTNGILLVVYHNQSAGL